MTTFTNGWTRKIEDLLENWSAQVSINELEYRKKATEKQRLYYGFGIFIIIAQAGAITSLVNVIANASTQNYKTLLVTLIIVAIIETLIAIAQGVDKLFNFGGESEKYQKAATDHAAFSRLIDATRFTPRIDRDPAKEVLVAIRNQFDELARNCPALPQNEKIHRLDMRIYNDPSEARGITDQPANKQVSHPNPDHTIIEMPRAESISMPPSPPDDQVPQDVDEETVTMSQRYKMSTKLQQAHRRDSNDLKNLEYQWRRMHQHEEADH